MLVWSSYLLRKFKCSSSEYGNQLLQYNEEIDHCNTTRKYAPNLKLGDYILTTMWYLCLILPVTNQKTPVPSKYRSLQTIQLAILIVFFVMLYLLVFQG